MRIYGPADASPPEAHIRDLVDLQNSSILRHKSYLEFNFLDDRGGAPCMRSEVRVFTIYATASDFTFPRPCEGKTLNIDKQNVIIDKMRLQRMYIFSVFPSACHGKTLNIYLKICSKRL